MNETITPNPAAASVAPAELDMLASTGAELDTDLTPADPNAPPPPAESPSMPTGEVLDMVLNPLFGILAPNWKITGTESRQLADVYGAVIDKYFPDAMNSFGPELSALLVTAAILGPRLAAGKPRKIEPKGKADESEPRAAS